MITKFLVRIDLLECKGVDYNYKLKRSKNGGTSLFGTQKAILPNNIFTQSRVDNKHSSTPKMKKKAKAGNEIINEICEFRDNSFNKHIEFIIGGRNKSKKEYISNKMMIELNIHNERETSNAFYFNSNVLQVESRRSTSENNISNSKNYSYIEDNKSIEAPLNFDFLMTADSYGPCKKIRSKLTTNNLKTKVFNDFYIPNDDDRNISNLSFSVMGTQRKDSDKNHINSSIFSDLSLNQYQYQINESKPQFEKCGVRPVNKYSAKSSNNKFSLAICHMNENEQVMITNKNKSNKKLSDNLIDNTNNNYKLNNLRGNRRVNSCKHFENETLHFNKNSIIYNDDGASNDFKLNGTKDWDDFSCCECESPLRTLKIIPEHTNSISIYSPSLSRISEFNIFNGTSADSKKTESNFCSSDSKKNLKIINREDMVFNFSKENYDKMQNITKIE